jgi:hypothetical protein
MESDRPRYQGGRIGDHDAFRLHEPDRGDEEYEAYRAAADRQKREADGATEAAVRMLAWKGAVTQMNWQDWEVDGFP